MRFQFLKEHQKEYNIQKACKLLRISRSEYYDYLNCRKSKRTIENEALIEMIEDIFHEHKARYGARRIQKVLEQQNVKVNHKRISRLMSEHGLIAKGTRKLYRYQANKTSYDEKDNILNQVFEAKGKNQIWVGDITYVPTKHGWLYLSVFIDTFSRKVVGWGYGDTLVLSALNQAIGREHPLEGLIIYTDRDSQYTSQRFQAMCIRYGFVQSMSRKGNPYDNAIMESFYRTLKRELVDGAKYDNTQQARTDIFKYIQTYYNSKRIHSALVWLSPNQFESQTINHS